MSETLEYVKESSPIVGRSLYFTCDVCCRRFASTRSLVKHLQCKHKTEPLPGINVEWINSIASPAVTDSGSRSRDKPKKVQFICPTCGHQFRRRYQLDEHLVTHTSEMPESVNESSLLVGRSSYSTCDICSSRFTSRRSLVRHLKRTHKIEPLSRNKIERINSIAPPAGTDSDSRSKDKPEKAQFICPTCGRQFRQRHQLDDHMVTHTGARPAACRYPGCNRRFGQTSTRNYHERTHSDMRPYVCSQCGQAFKHSTILRTHVAAIHGSGTRPHQCSQCGKAFKRQGALHVHYTTVHSDKKPHSCTECSKRFQHRSHLARHVRALHSHERPWQCSICDQTFTQSGNLRTHMRMHTGEKPYSCSVCGQSFAHSGTLKGHMATHRHLNEHSNVDSQTSVNTLPAISQSVMNSLFQQLSPL